MKNIYINTKLTSKQLTNGHVIHTKITRIKISCGKILKLIVFKVNDDR